MSEKAADPSVEGQTTARHAARTVFPDVYDNSEDARGPTNTTEGKSMESIKVAAIWCRVSTNSQTELYLDSQELAVRTAVESQGTEGHKK